MLSHPICSADQRHGGNIILAAQLGLIKSFVAMDPISPIGAISIGDPLSFNRAVHLLDGQGVPVDIII